MVFLGLYGMSPLAPRVSILTWAFFRRFLLVFGTTGTCTQKKAKRRKSAAVQNVSRRLRLPRQPFGDGGVPQKLARVKEEDRHDGERKSVDEILVEDEQGH